MAFCRAVSWIVIATTIASGPAQVVEPRNFLARARASLEAGQVEQALAYARRAVAANGENADAQLLLGILLERRADRDGAISALARAALLNAESDIARDRLHQLLQAGYPSGIDAGALGALPGEISSGDLRFTDARLTGVPFSRRWMTLSPSGTESADAIDDPKYGRRYPHVSYAYVLDAGSSRWYRVASVRHQKAWDAALARRVSGLLGELFWVRREYWGRTPDFPRPQEARIWLAREGKAGGEEWRGEIYLYEVGRERTPEEWVRQVAHEYGHIALPGAPYYTTPEPKANGYLGERLLVDWLRCNAPKSWDGEVDLARYVERRVTPLRRRFLAAGPESSDLLRRDAAGMEYLIGMALAWERLHGPRLLRVAFDQMRGQNGESFRIGCQEAIEGLLPPRLTVTPEPVAPPTAGGGGARHVAWLYLPAGTWSARLPDGVRSARWGEQRLLPSGSGGATVSLVAPAAEWRRFEVVTGSAAPVRIELTRGGARP